MDQGGRKPPSNPATALLAVAVAVGLGWNGLNDGYQLNPGCGVTLCRILSKRKSEDGSEVGPRRKEGRKTENGQWSTKDERRAAQRKGRRALN